METKSLLKNLTGDSLLYGISTIALRLISFILFPLFARKFTPEDYGVVGLLSTFTFFVTALCGMGLDSATARWYYDNTEPLYMKQIFSNWFFVQFGATMLVSLLIITGLLFFPSGNFLKTQHPETLVILVCVNMLLNIPLSIVNLFYVLQRKPLPSVYFSVAVALLSALVSLLLVFKFNLGLIGFYLGQTIALLLCSIVAIVIAVKKLIHFNYPDVELIKKMVKYGASIIPANISSYFLLFVSSIIIRSFISQADLGYYQVGYTIASGILILTIPFNQAFQPLSFSIMHQPHAGKFYELIFDIYCAAMCLVCLVLGLFLKEIMHFLVTDKYAPSTFIAATLSFSNFIYSINTIAVIGMAIEKKIRYFGIIVALCNLLNIGLVFFGTRLGGINGTALSFVLGNCITIFLLFYYSQKIHFIPYRFLPNVLLIATSFVLFCAGYEMFRSGTAASFIWRTVLLLVFAAILTGRYFWRKKAIQSLSTYLQ